MGAIRSRHRRGQLRAFAHAAHPQYEDLHDLVRSKARPRCAAVAENDSMKSQAVLDRAVPRRRTSWCDSFLGPADLDRDRKSPRLACAAFRVWWATPGGWIGVWVWQSLSQPFPAAIPACEAPATAAGRPGEAIAARHDQIAAVTMVAPNHRSRGRNRLCGGNTTKQPGRAPAQRKTPHRCRGAPREVS